jgi:hypothetical protein
MEFPIETKTSIIDITNADNITINSEDMIREANDWLRQ